MNKINLYLTFITCLVFINSDAQSTNDPSLYVTGNTVKPDSTEIYTIVEEMPDYPGGSAALNEFIIKNLVYPETARRDSVAGKVFMNFIVNESGKIENAKILRGLTDDINNEALRVINMMPEWKPGKQNGKNVKVSYNLPLNFKLN